MSEIECDPLGKSNSSFQVGAEIEILKIYCRYIC